MSDNPRSLPRAPNPESSTPQLSTSTLRQQLKDATIAAVNKTPFPWQLDVAEALCNRRDALCIAGTGKGKTLAFVMPYFVDPRALIWIVSPLNYIQKQQERTFREDWRLPACAVNATTSYPGLHKDILNGKYRIIITSPEQLLEYNKLRPIIIQLGAANWNNIVIVDECHCICIWSDQFRKMYGLLGTLRVFLLPGTPFCAATATATRSMQEQVRSSLRFPKEFAFVNEGYWKPNLSWHVYYMQASDSSIGEITYLIPRNPDRTSPLPIIIIFVDERNLGFDILKMLREYLPEWANQIEIYHALQSQLAKDLIVDLFTKGLIRILICTEALTMGCDFRHIELVILFKVPKTLSTVLQRGGRGGRDEKIWCRVVLMVEASKQKKAVPYARTDDTAEVVKSEENALADSIEPVAGAVIGIDNVAASEQVDTPGPEGEDDDDDTRKAIQMVSVAHGKEDKQYLEQFFAPGEHCRTAILDAAFDSPAHPPCISVNGCDNCIHHRIKELEGEKCDKTHEAAESIKQELLDLDLNALDAQEAAIQDLRSRLFEPPPQEKATTKKPRAKYRSTSDRAELEEHMLTWRQSIYKTEFKGTGMSANHIITGKALTAISCIPPPVTLLSLSHTSPAWPKKAHARWGASLLAIVVAFDEPARIAERKAEAAQIQRTTKPMGAKKKEVIKVEDSQGSSKGKKRVASSSRTIAPSTPAAKKQRQDAPGSSALANSALSAGPSSWPFPLDSAATISTTPTQHANASPTTLSSMTSPLARVSSSRDPLRHYRPQTHTPSPRPPHSAIRTPESVTQSTQAVDSSNHQSSARAVGKMWIQTTPKIPKTPTQNSEPSTCNSTPDPSPSKSRGPESKRSAHYREHLYK